MAVLEAVRYYGEKLTDSLYQLSVASVLAFSGALLMLAVVAVAVTTGAVDVPEFHPK
ncbi:hypothetical protein [Methylocystis parvus]|uniref:hypothetical protein n=1 Tax=Methylocystis parvus TaxID=134 RepID=UPI0002E8BCFB|nr:hypothetical protein [Methylocystis parvus]WBK00511.1 hypothetical protein MMG94_01960 [Methylocystis parvus OBBP]